MEERLYYLGFSLAKGIGPKTFATLLSYFKTAQKAWNANSKKLKKAVLGEKTLANFEKTLWFTPEEGHDYKRAEELV